jgi:alpha-mannosidase
MSENDSTASQTPAAAPSYTMILDQSAHLDWDWIRTFAQNYWYYTNGSGVNSIIAAGIRNAQSGAGAYYYTVCEMGFFRRFVEENPGQVAAIKALGNNFQVIGGGVTSPDCLVCSGEGFIRNYLVGQSWLKGAVGLSPRLHCWIPDDFGQSPELPVLLTALAFAGVSFSRIPGGETGALATKFNATGFDFMWESSDGSSAFAHWLPVSYAFGNKLSAGASAISDFVAAYGPTGQPPTYKAARTPFMYIPIDDDFSMPVGNLLASAAEWNNNSVPGGGPAATGVTVVPGTFAGFYDGVMQTPQALSPFQSYNGTPVWTGYYASRPALKKLHHETVRALVAAEVFGLLTQPWNGSVNGLLPKRHWDDVDETWTDFAPSTHHDYICGTAPDAVYANDQLPLLRGAEARARSLRASALNALAGTVVAQWGTSVMVANSLGFGRGGVAEVEGIAPAGSAVRWSGGSTTATQPSSDGGMLVLAQAPSFGYLTGQVVGGAPAVEGAAAVSPTSPGAQSYTLSNGLISATIGANVGWSIASVLDIAGSNAEMLSGPANAPLFYNDDGGLYRFGNEIGAKFEVDSSVGFTIVGPGLGAVLLETGPLRVRVRTTIMVTLSNGQSFPYVREYSLVAGEPFLRMTTIGSAPSGYSVMTAFPLAAPVASIDHGTPYHWTSVQPASGPGFWGPPLFVPTHDFLIPASTSGAVLGAVYHSSVPAWAYDPNGTLIGCLFRNTPGDGGLGATGSDSAVHSQSYALRVPTGLGVPSTGQPLREALGFNTPVQAVEMPAGGNYPGMITAPQGSLASVGAGSPAILTVAKPGTYDPSALVLRLYQPSNTSQSVAVALAGGTCPAPALVSAAETAPSPGGEAGSFRGGFAVDMEFALATVLVPGFGRVQGARPPADAPTA